MKKLTVLIDMDDTIENLCETWVNYLNEQYKTKANVKDINNWDMLKAFPSLSSEDLFRPLSENSFWSKVKPLPGAVEYIKQIRDDGHKVFIVTASHPSSVNVKLNNVLFKYFPYLNYTDVIITSNKQMIKGDILIDDALHNLIGGDYKGVLMAAPHNKDYTGKEFKRVNNWEEAYNVVCDYAKEGRESDSD